MSKSRILVIDIETSPGLGYFWRIFDENIGIEQIVEPSRIICACFKWHGEAGVTFLSEWKDGSGPMLLGIHKALREADAVVTFNGDKFDLPRLNGEFIREGFDPLPPLTSIDLRKTTKKLGLMSGKLDYVVQYYDIGKKLEHEGFKLWRKVLEGDEDAMARMERYNRKDVKLTAKLYRFLRPYMDNHPYIQPSGMCSACGSDDLTHRGYRYTKTMQTERLQCKVCGKWNIGKRNKK